MNIVNTIASNADTSLNEVSDIKAKLQSMKREIRIAQKIMEYTKKLNNESIADIGQLTTISKQRIVQPCNNKDVLFNVIVSEEIMTEIENKIKFLYFNIDQKQ